MGPQVPNAFVIFVVRAPKFTLLAAKTVSKTTPTSTHDDERRLLHLPPIAEEVESGKIPVSAAIDCCERGPGASFSKADEVCVGAGHVYAWGSGWIGSAERESAFI